MNLIINFILGIPLLIWGRKAFWLFVGTIGFITGFWLAQQYLTVNVEWVLILVGIALGLAGVFFAIFLQKLSITITGFLAGVYIMMSAVKMLSFNAGPWNWFIYIIGGMIGTFLVIAIFDWALIILSSLVGAALISQASFRMAELDNLPRSLIFLVLLIIGLVLQYEQKMREPS
jgi:hypothetical protein